MKSMLEKWKQYMTEGTLVGKGMGKNLVFQLEDITKLVQYFDPYSETSPLSEDVRAEIILHFENLQDAIQKFYPGND